MHQFNGTPSSEILTGSKDSAGGDRTLVRGHNNVFSCTDWRKSWKNLSRKLAEIQTEHLPSTCLEGSCCNRTPGENTDSNWTITKVACMGTQKRVTTVHAISQSAVRFRLNWITGYWRISHHWQELVLPILCFKPTFIHRWVLNLVTENGIIEAGVCNYLGNHRGLK
jgi:hypothetical protein